MCRLLGYQGIAVVMEELLKVVKSLVSKADLTLCMGGTIPMPSHLKGVFPFLARVGLMSNSIEREMKGIPLLQRNPCLLLFCCCCCCCTASGHYNAVCEDSDGGDAQDLPAASP